MAATDPITGPAIQALDWGEGVGDGGGIVGVGVRD